MTTDQERHNPDGTWSWKPGNEPRLTMMSTKAGNRSSTMWRCAVCLAEGSMSGNYRWPTLEQQGREHCATHDGEAG